MHKIPAFVQERFAEGFRKSIAEAVAKIQSRLVPALPEQNESLPGEKCLLDGDWLQLDREVFHKGIQYGAPHPIFVPIDVVRSVQAHRGNPSSSYSSA
jgi:hypothetical protein